MIYVKRGGKWVKKATAKTIGKAKAMLRILLQWQREHEK